MLVETKVGKISCPLPAGTMSEIVLSIRPEHIEVFKQGENSEKGRNIVQGTVNSATFLGSTIDCTVRVGSEILKVQVLSSKYVIEGEQVDLYLPPQFCIPLPAE